MKYISKGAVMRPGTEEILYISRCGSEYVLSKPMSMLWLEGRHRISETRSELELAKLTQLEHMGLVELVGEDSDSTSIYKALTHCVILPATLRRLRRRLNKDEQQLWLWINQAGMHLTTAEIVFLRTHGIEPRPDLLGKQNFQKLTEMMYTPENFSDNLLESEMERAAGRDAAVSTILGLLKKKHLVLV